MERMNDEGNTICAKSESLRGIRTEREVDTARRAVARAIHVENAKVDAGESRDWLVTLDQWEKELWGYEKKTDEDVVDWFDGEQSQLDYVVEVFGV